MKSGFMKTLNRFIVEQERLYPEATGTFTNLVTDIALAGKVISYHVNKAGIVNILGKLGTKNVFGETQEKLDVFASELLMRTLVHGGNLCAMASEEADGLIPIPDDYPKGKYVCCFDPLDGSSNIDVGVSIGTIFSIFRRVTPDGGAGTLEDLLQPGCKQVCAGYVIYGSSTMLVFSTGNGVHGFTFDPSFGEFVLSNENIKIPTKGKFYSINEGNTLKWDEPIRRYIEWAKQDDASQSLPYSGRYIGSLVADFHRNLLRGGIFLYPGNKTNPSGKLRLMYEANALAYIVEQAGGSATDGINRILDIQPKVLHQQVPLTIGSKEDVEIFGEFMTGKR